MHRDGTFTIADARGCPVSQQARFHRSAAVRSPKGPTVNLAEEADYDDTQARLAGIQRLLAIAGYDANPIDGVQGAKTQAALDQIPQRPQTAGRRRRAAGFLRQLMAAASNPEGPGFTWCNETSYTVMAALGVAEMGAIVTRGWYRIDAGQCLRPDLRGDPHRIYSYAEAVDARGRAIQRGGGRSPGAATFRSARAMASSN